MAATPSSSALLFLLLLQLAVLAMASTTGYNGQPSFQVPLPSLCPCNCPKENETRLHMYLHQFPALPNVPQPNEVAVISSTQSIGFGQMYVDDWFLSMGPDPNEKIIGRAHGFHIQAGQTITSWFAGSTLQVLGITYPQPNGQWSITGGTGIFTNAHGSVKFSASASSTASDAIKELDIHVFYTPEMA